MFALMTGQRERVTNEAKLWCQVAVEEKYEHLVSKESTRIKLPPCEGSKDGTSSGRPSSERIEGFWPRLCGLHGGEWGRGRAYAIGAKV